MDDKLSTVTMSSADWQRNEQRHENREKRMLIIIIILAVAIILQHAAWLTYESQFVTVSDGGIEYSNEVSQSTETGSNSFIGNEGSIVNGNTNDKADG